MTRLSVDKTKKIWDLSHSRSPIPDEPLEDLTGCSKSVLPVGMGCPVAGSLHAPYGMGDFKKLEVWRKAHALTLNTYRAFRRIRGAEHMSLRSQTIKAAMSIADNIVEGNGLKTRRDFRRFLGYSVNSSNELENHFIVAHDLGLMPTNVFRSLIKDLEEVRRMLYGLIKYLSREDDSEDEPTKDLGSQQPKTSDPGGTTGGPHG
jgi:four helix bundle protein